MRAAGVYPRRMRHVPALHRDRRHAGQERRQASGVLVAGRLSPEKGYRRRDSRCWRDRWRVCSTSPAPARTRQRCAGSRSRSRRVGCAFTAWSTRRRCSGLMLAAAVVVVPSTLVREPADGGARGARARRPGRRQRLGGMPELIEPGVTGDLVPANDPHALAAALRPYVTDPARGFAMRDRARATIVDRILTAAASRTHRRDVRTRRPHAAGSRGMRPARIAFIGQRGVPATIGGIEHHVEEIGSRLVARGTT